MTLQVAAGAGRGFLVSGTGSLSLRNLTLLGGGTAAPTTSGTGPVDQGGVEVAGTGAGFTADHVLFENLQNAADGYGAAVWVNTDPTLTPTAGADGTATIRDSSFVGNYAFYGGAVAIGELSNQNAAPHPGTLQISNSSFQGNSAIYYGGALFFGAGSVVSLASDTIDGNQTLDTGFSRGGGYRYDTDVLGRKGQTGFGTLTVANIIVANNTTADAGGVASNNCNGQPDTQDGLNLEYDAGGSTACGFALNGTDPNLTFVTPPAVTATTPGQSLNGGLVTPYWKINAIGSPAVDAVPAKTCLDASGAALTADQIGDPRPSGTACDIGAYELPQVYRLVILCGNPQSANANSAFAQPLIVQAQDINGTPLNGQHLTYTVGSGTNGATGTLSSVSPPASGVATLTGTTGPVTLPANCPNPGTSVQGAGSFTLTANGTPSLPGTSYPVTVTVAGLPAGTVTPIVFAATNLQRVAAACAVRVAFFTSLDSTNGSYSTQFSLVTGTPGSLNPTHINYLYLRGSGGTLRVSPKPGTLTCLIGYDPPAFPAVHLPQQVDFDASVLSSSVAGIAAPSTIHVTIKQDLLASPPVQSVTITNALGTATYFTFNTSNTSIAPQAFQIAMR